MMRQGSGGGMDMMKGRLAIAVIIALFSLCSYYSSSQRNPVTGEVQRIGNITPQQEVQMGLQALPQMLQEFRGESRNVEASQLVDEVGNELVRNSPAAQSEYKFDFHLLADKDTVNAFALPGGQIFITECLLTKLETRGQLAGVLGHEIGHVLARHGAERMAKAQLTQGLTGAAVMASGSQNSAQLAMMVGNMINMKYGREDELESDKLGLKFMVSSGYDPRALIGVMEILERATGGGRGQPEFMSSHPNPGNRIGNIKEIIRETFPNGLPANLQP